MGYNLMCMHVCVCLNTHDEFLFLFLCNYLLCVTTVSSYSCCVYLSGHIY
jgi:hypothetical protein